MVNKKSYSFSTIINSIINLLSAFPLPATHIEPLLKSDKVILKFLYLPASIVPK